MKKHIVILIMTLLGYQSINAQLTEVKNDPEVLKDPIMPRKKGNDQYRLTYARDTFLISNEPLNVWWRVNIIQTINEAYAAKGSSRRLDGSNVNWIRERISYSYKDIGPHQNSGLQDKNPVYFPDNDGFSGNFGVFRDDEEGIVVILFKTQCMNLVKVPQKVTIKTPPIVYRKPDIVDTVRATAGVTVINNIYNNNSIENSGNSNSISSVETPTSTGTEYVITGRDNGFTREVGWGYQQQQVQRPMRVQVALQIQSGRQQRYYQPQQQQVIRNMPPGIPSNATSTGGGIPATRRNMPGGIRRG